MALFSLFESAAARDGKREAILTPSGEVPFGALHARALRIAALLHNRVQRPGGVALVLRSGTDLLAAFLGCMATGRPAVPLDPEQPPASLNALLTRPDFAAALTGGESAEAKETCPFIPLAEEAGHECAASASACRPDAEFYWGLTSGTTGPPDLLARTHASWIASFEAMEAVFPFPPDAKILVPGPLHHSLFLFGALHALCRGRTVILPPAPFRAGRLSGSQATHLYAAPFMLEMLLAARTPLPGLQTIFCGGARLGEALREGCEALWPGADLIGFYGATETSFVTYASTRRPAGTVSAGRPFPGVRIRICGSDGAPLPQEREGEIFVSSPMTYARRVGGETAGKWVSAGDSGFLDAGGFLHLTGRMKRTINTKGLKIRPEIVEDALLSHGAVAEAAVVGIPDRLRGEAAAAVVVLAPGSAVSRSDLAAWCRTRLGAKACPRQFFETDALPKTSTGKIAVAVLKDMLASGRHGFRDLP